MGGNLRPDPLIGETIGGRFRLERLLGRGGHGAVYKARHVRTGGAVALKLLRDELSTDPQAVRRFHTEARLTHKLQHSNTVRLVDFGETDGGSLFLAMEFVEGRPLSALLAEHGALPADRAVSIFEEVLKSLGEAHALGIVHRDVKPANVMLNDEFGQQDAVKLLDFGIARGGGDGTTTQATTPLGTPKYMAPEQWLGGRVLPAADIYAAGCMLYEMIAGHPPFVPQEAPAQVALYYMTMHLNMVPQPLGTAAPGRCSEALSALVDRMIAKDPARRPRDAAAALVALQEALGLAPATAAELVPTPAPAIPATAPHPLDMATLEPGQRLLSPMLENAAAPSPPSPQPTAPARGTPRRPLALAAVLALLVAGSAAAAFALGDAEPATPSVVEAASLRSLPERPPAPQLSPAPTAAKADPPQPAPSAPAVQPATPPEATIEAPADAKRQATRRSKRRKKKASKTAAPAKTAPTKPGPNRSTKEIPPARF